ncbi:MAG TPA: hypothetical protein PLV68_08590, partial [Ilumatobacteraceae bacterium]|nr:hypothetical protein [Ilumatobacteraceae bacterium]
HSAMTAGHKPAPFATTPAEVAKIAAAGIRRGRRVVWAPKVMRPMFMVLRHLPGPVFRRLPM